MPHPLVSVLLPAYKHERYIQEAIRSIIAQSYQNLELLLIDDGSPDNTWAMVEELRPECERRFKRVIMHRQENTGLCNTYNKLLAEAQGDYVFIVNSDDIARQGAIETLVKFLEQNGDYAVAVGNNDIIDEGGNKIYWDKKKRVAHQKSSGFYGNFKEFFAHRHVDYEEEFGRYETLINKGNHIPNGYLIRRSIFDIIGGYTDEAPMEDYYIFLQISKFSKIKYIDEILFSYRWHGSNTLQLRDSSYRFEDRTLAYEKKLLDASGPEMHRKIFYAKLNKERPIFNLGKVLRVYKIKNFLHKKIFVQFAGKTFKIYHKDCGFNAN